MPMLPPPVSVSSSSCGTCTEGNAGFGEVAGGGGGKGAGTMTTVDVLKTVGVARTSVLSSTDAAWGELS